MTPRNEKLSLMVKDKFEEEKLSEHTNQRQLEDLKVHDDQQQ